MAGDHDDDDDDVMRMVVIGVAMGQGVEIGTELVCRHDDPWIVSCFVNRAN